MTVRRPKNTTLRSYLVTLMWAGAASEEIEIEAISHAAALKKGRQWKNEEYGRTQSCNTLRCTVKARRMSETL